MFEYIHSIQRSYHLLNLFFDIINMVVDWFNFSSIVLVKCWNTLSRSNYSIPPLKRRRPPGLLRFFLGFLVNLFMVIPHAEKQL